MNVYQGVCIGGPNAGHSMAHQQPEYEFAITPGMPNLNPEYQPPKTDRVHVGWRRYYFIPYMGFKGFWVFEEIITDKHPLDSITGHLVESYVELQQLKGTVQ